MRLLINFLIFAFLSSSAWATTWYVRDKGGTPAQCTGTVNAVYPGTGSNQPCALANPMYVLGAGCGNYGFGPCNVPGIMGNGDTLDIVGDSDINPGQQAQYPIGYDASGVITPINSSNCSAGGSLNCTMANLPSGIDATHLTQVIGIGTHRPQLWGREKINQILEADNNYVLINNLEITDHSACIADGALVGPNVDGSPLVCQTSGPPFGNWAIQGLFLGGTGSTWKNIWVHGIGGYKSAVDSDNFTNLTSINNVVSGNAFNGDGPGQIYSGSTATFNGWTIDNEKVLYNGCGEHYPMHSSDPYDTANYHNCHDAGAGGQGDGLGCQANNCIMEGNITVSNSDISFNTQDGVDFLHAGAVGTFYFYRDRFEGNEGQQFKTNGVNTYVENSMIVGDCAYFSGQSFTYNEGGNAEICRAGGEAINIVLNGGTTNIENSTVLVTGPGIQDAGASAPCAGTLNWYNDNVIGGWNTPGYGNNALATWIDSECTSGGFTFNEDYNHVWQVSGSGPQCGSSPGTHDKCTDTSASVTGNLLSALGPSSYYTGNDLAHLLYPSSGGQLPASANSSLALTGTPNDFNNFSRGSSWTIGGYQLNSCVVTGGTCFEVGECCGGGTCSNHVCSSGTCTAIGGSCSSGTTCCSTICSQSISQCVSCVATGNICAKNSDCCTGVCSGSTCTVPPSSSNILVSALGKTSISGICNF